jgi:hypothetical protein
MIALQRFSLALVFILLAGAATAQSSAPITKEALKQEYAGTCKNPEKAFPTPPPKEKMESFNLWCSCVSTAIENIPNEKLQQVSAETFDEYAKYRADPKGFVPTKEFSMIRISKACIAK